MTLIFWQQIQALDGRGMAGPGARQNQMLSRDWRRQIFELQGLVEDEEVLAGYA